MYEDFLGKILKFDLGRSESELERKGNRKERRGWCWQSSEGVFRACGAVILNHVLYLCSVDGLPTVGIAPLSVSNLLNFVTFIDMHIGCCW